MNILKTISFGLLGVLTLGIMGATIAEKYCGTTFALSFFYQSSWMIAIWILTAIFTMAYVLKRRSLMSVSALLLHSSFIIILAGAGITYICGERGKIILKQGESPSGTFAYSDGKRSGDLPFKVALKNCGIEYYPGTSTPMDYYTDIEIFKSGHISTERVSMNNILSIDGFRFYQTALGDGYSILSISFDPWGITVSYLGYAIMAISMTTFFFNKKCRFKSLIKTIGTIILILSYSTAMAANKTPVPKTFQQPLAKDFGQLYVYWGNRIVPMQTLARDFCLKIYGKDSYKGLSPEQVLTGWLFYYDDWKHEPMIKIKGENVRKLLGITTGKYASLKDFYSRDRYKLRHLLSGNLYDREYLAADEKANLISLICTGKGIKIIPLKGSGNSIGWYSWVERLPDNSDKRMAGEIPLYMERVAKEAAHGHYNNADSLIRHIKKCQIESVGRQSLPGTVRFQSELIYNHLSSPLPTAIIALLTGGVAFVLFCRKIGKKKLYMADTVINRIVITIACLLSLYLTAIIILRGIIGDHLPLSNGFEVMQAMAWLCLLIIHLLMKRFPVVLPAGLIVCGLAMLVAFFGESNPSISHLLPVLASPLLSFHVTLIMTSYALFAIMALNSVSAFIIGSKNNMYGTLADVSEILLYPAVFLLGIGIFVGAIWANQSWGRYWGWDPKESWAIITFIIYAFPIHRLSFPCFNRSKIRHIYFLAAFLSVLMTYFGVNYFLSGLHSYVN